MTCPQLLKLDVEVEVQRLDFGCFGAAANVHLKTTRAKASIDLVEARGEVITRVDEELAVARKEGGLEPKEPGVPLAVQILAHGNAAFAAAVTKLGDAAFTPATSQDYST